MSQFLKEITKENSFELLIDPKIFPKDIILKTSYNFLDICYFFFRYNEDRNIILEWTLKKSGERSLHQLVSDFSDEMLDVYLRDKIERENRIIRESIVNKALFWPLDTWAFVSHDPENPSQTQMNAEDLTQDIEETAEIDFDKDIDEIIKEIENDPDLQIDEDEIQQMLKEIEEETQQESIEKPNIVIDPASVKAVKNQFKNKD